MVLNYLSTLSIILGIIVGFFGVYEIVKNYRLERFRNSNVIFILVAIALLLAPLVLNRISSSPNTSNSGSDNNLQSPILQTPISLTGTNATPTQTLPTQIPIATVAPTPTPVPIVPGQVLYQTTNFNDWSGTPDWKIVGGKLVNDGSTGYQNESPPTISPSFSPATPDYAVEATIVVTATPPYDYDSFGIVVRAGNVHEGYLAGVGPRNFSGANVSYNDLNLYFCPLGGASFNPGRVPHVYRVEVKGNQIKFKIDGELLVQVTDNKYLTGEVVGLWSALVQIEVTSLKVIAL